MKQQSDSSVMKKVKTLKVTSQAFSYMDSIPQKFTRDGENVSPPVSIEEIPEETKSLALIVEDSDAPSQTWVHWLLWNISPSATIKWNIAPSFLIKENTAPGLEGKNDFGNVGYDGPSPPSGKHRYSFRVYALDDTLELASGAVKPELENAMKLHIIAYGELIGLYGRI